MIEIIKTEKDNIIGIKCVGLVTQEDYQNILIPFLEEAIPKYGPLRAFCDMREFMGMEWKALWDDFKYGIKHTKDVERIATVGDQRWVAWLMKFSSLFYKMKLKHFNSSQVEEAWNWVNEEDEVSTSSEG